MKKVVLFESPIVVLGKGIEKEGVTIRLTIESTMSTIAAGLLFKLNPRPIIFTGGPTLGKEYLSEAELMQQFLFERFPEIPRDKVLTEPVSIDTYGNITEMLDKGFLHSSTSVFVLSVSQHLRRAKILFRNIAKITAKTRSSQQVLLTYGLSKDRQMVRNYTKSRRYMFEISKEIILNFIVIFDRKGKLLRNVTKITRHSS